MKKYNNQTKCYKIDIFINGCYECSTDWAKTCKEAKNRFIEKHKLEPFLAKKVTAHFYKD